MTFFLRMILPWIEKRVEVDDFGVIAMVSSSVGEYRSRGGGAASRNSTSKWRENMQFT